MAVVYAQYGKEYSGLAQQFRVTPVSCGNHSHYEEYLKYCATSDHKTGKGKTYIILDEETPRIVGFVTLRASSLIFKDDNLFLGRSAIEITELAVDINYEKQGYGRILVDLALTIVDTLRNECLGIEYISLCADPISVPFYVYMGFSKIDDFYEIPRDGWNNNCIPMALKLPELD